MADVRGIPVTPLFAFSQLTAVQGIGPGFTVGNHYWPLGLAYDNAANVTYVVTADDAGKLQAVPASSFRFSIEGLAFLPPTA